MTSHQARTRASDLMSDHANIRTIPAVPGVAFVMASLGSKATTNRYSNSIDRT